VSLGVDFRAMAKSQLQDDDVQLYRSNRAKSGMQIADVHLDEDHSLLCDFSTGKPRPIVQPEFRRQIFDLINGLSHPGRLATKRLIADKYVWHRMKTDLRKWTSQCQARQLAKVDKHTRAPLEEFPVPAKRFTHIHFDLVGPLQPSQGHTHLLTIVDRTSRWPEAIPLREEETNADHWPIGFPVLEPHVTSHPTAELNSFQPCGL